MFILNRLRMNRIVFGMAAEPLDINNLPPVIDRNDEAEVVTLNIEHHPIRADDAGFSKRTLQLGGILPCGAADLVEPGIQSVLHRLLPFFAGKRLDEARQRAASDHPQTASITRSRTGNKLDLEWTLCAKRQRLTDSADTSGCSSGLRQLPYHRVH